MMTSARAVVTPGALAELSSRPPLTIRQVRARPGTIGLCLVGTAAGPLAGDELRLTLDVAAEARAELVAAGASIAQGGASRTAASVRLGAGARLDADPGPLIVSAGARVDVELSIEVEPTSALVWREFVVLGRTGEPAGLATVRWDVARGGLPVLRQHVDLAYPELAGWPGMTAGCRVLVSELRLGPDVDARTVVHSPTAVTQRLADGATLTTVLAASAAAAEAVLPRWEAGQQAVTSRSSVARRPGPRPGNRPGRAVAARRGPGTGTAEPAPAAGGQSRSCPPGKAKVAPTWWKPARLGEAAARSPVQDRDSASARPGPRCVGNAPLAIR
jgi:urease accessory protein